MAAYARKGMQFGPRRDTPEQHQKCIIYFRSGSHPQQHPGRTHHTTARPMDVSNSLTESEGPGWLHMLEGVCNLGCAENSPEQHQKCIIYFRSGSHPQQHLGRTHHTIARPMDVSNSLTESEGPWWLHMLDGVWSLDRAVST